MEVEGHAYTWVKNLLVNILSILHQSEKRRFFVWRFFLTDTVGLGVTRFSVWILQFNVVRHFCDNVPLEPRENIYRILDVFSSSVVRLGVLNDPNLGRNVYLMVPLILTILPPERTPFVLQPLNLSTKYYSFPNWEGTGTQDWYYLWILGPKNVTQYHTSYSSWP